MNNSDSSERTSKQRMGRSEHGFLRLLRSVAPIAVVVGAVGSLILTLYAGRGSHSHILQTLFALWVLSPFVALVFANMVLKRWSILFGTTLHALILIVSGGSLVIYLNDVLNPPTLKRAFVFVVVPLASWLLIAIVALIVALRSRRLSRQ